LTRVKTEFAHTPPHARMFYVGDTFWQIVASSDEQPGQVETYDPNTLSRTMDTAAFTTAHAELKPGIVDLRIEDDPVHLALTTSDGLKYVFLLADKKLLPADAYAK